MICLLNLSKEKMLRIIGDKALGKGYILGRKYRIILFAYFMM